MSEVKYTEAEIEKIKDRILEALEMVIVHRRSVHRSAARHS